MGWNVNNYRSDSVKNYCCNDNSNECEHVEVATIDGRMYGVATHALSMDAYMN